MLFDEQKLPDTVTAEKPSQDNLNLPSGRG